MIEYVIEKFREVWLQFDKLNKLILDLEFKIKRLEAIIDNGY